jgi:hypothetical protein
LGEGTKPFDAVVTIPRLVIKAKYTSSGVLIIIPASGGGEFNAVFGKNTLNLIKIIGHHMNVWLACYGFPE